MINKPFVICILFTIGLSSCTLPAPQQGSNSPSYVITSYPTSISPTLPKTSPIPSPSVTPIPDKIIQDGEYALFLGEYAIAIQLFQNALNGALDPKILAAALYGISRAEFSIGNIPTALTYFNQLIEKYPASPYNGYSNYYLGQIYSSLNQFENAINAYNRFIKLRSGKIDSFIQELLGDAFSAEGKYQEAIAAYQSAAALPHSGSSEAVNIKEANNMALSGDPSGAIQMYTAIYQTSTNDYTKAQLDLLIGQNEMALGNSDVAVDRFQDAVNNYPRSNDSYQALVNLVNANIPVDDLNRGLVDYFAGQFEVAIQAFDRYLSNPKSSDPATAHYYKGLALQAIDPMDKLAIQEWQTLVKDYPADHHWLDALENVAYAQWSLYDDPSLAAQTLLSGAKLESDQTSVAGLIFDAGRYYERADKLSLAAQTWESLADQFPNASQTSDALIFAGVCYYRLSDYPKAQKTFERALLLTVVPQSQAKALLWIGKAQAIQKNLTDAEISWQKAATSDPTGYYSDRAQDLLLGSPIFHSSPNIKLTIDLSSEKTKAESWMETTFSIGTDTDLSNLGDLANDPRIIRGEEFWNLGLYEKAQSEYEDLYSAVQSDPIETFRLIQFFEDRGLYRQAIIASRQVLTSAGMNDATTLTAPKYFNHIRFGLYYKDDVLSAAKSEGLDPLFLFSVIRQESLFDSSIASTAGAVGLMQLLPSTAADVVKTLGWPADYRSTDLTRPNINITLGAHYLIQFKEYLDNNLYAMLAAYNGGPGNASAWVSLAPDDPDLFLEVVRIQETRNYIMGIVENFEIYRILYAEQQ